VRITRDQQITFTILPERLVEKEEKTLYGELEKAEAKERAAGSVDDFLTVFTPLIPAINLFFDKVLVMTEDREVRENRLGLLQRIAALTGGVADFGRLEGF
jgi:glycyl-tRNA synthetase beta subunit